MQITYSAIPTETVRAWRAGTPDIYGNAPERQVADGGGYQCRHCLNLIPEGADMLLVAHRPFDHLDAYSETGPIFVCAEPCTGFGTQATQPPSLRASPEFLLKGYGANDRIVYGTGAIVASEIIPDRAAEVFADPAASYIHVRSARNNCYQARIDRA